MVWVNDSRRIFLLVISTICLVGCFDKQKTRPTKTSQVKSQKQAIDTSSESRLNWANPLIIKYIRKSHNELIDAIKKDTTPIEWLFDRTEIIDSSKYFVFQLGRSDEYRFTTEAWLYIDSATKQLYEYDVAKDSLIKWNESLNSP